MPSVGKALPIKGLPAVGAGPWLLRVGRGEDGIIKMGKQRRQDKFKGIEAQMGSRPCCVRHVCPGLGWCLWQNLPLAQADGNNPVPVHLHSRLSGGTPNISMTAEPHFFQLTSSWGVVVEMVPRPYRSKPCFSLLSCSPLKVLMTVACMPLVTRSSFPLEAAPLPSWYNLDSYRVFYDSDIQSLSLPSTYYLLGTVLGAFQALAHLSHSVSSFPTLLCFPLGGL